MSSGNEPTIQNIADKLNLSKSTVSRALSGHGRISADTRRRVMAAVEEHGYRPNAIARSLAVSRTGNIVALLPPYGKTLTSAFYYECLDGILEMAAFEDFDVLVAACDGDNPAPFNRLIVNQKADGVILIRPFGASAMAEAADKSGLPYLMIGSVQDCTAVQVDADNTGAARELTSHLLIRSPGKTAFIGGNPELPSMRDRLNGFNLAHEERGLALRDGYVLCGFLSESQVHHHLTRLFRNDPPQAILTADDTLCRWTLTGLSRLDLNVPDDVRLASLSDSDYLSNHKPPVTAVNTSPRLMGETACRLLIDWINGEKPRQNYIVPHQISLKASTGL